MPVTVSVTLAPEDRDPGAFDAHAPQPLPRNVIESAIERAIAETPTPSMLPGGPLDRLAPDILKTAGGLKETGGDGE